MVFALEKSVADFRDEIGSEAEAFKYNREELNLTGDMDANGKYLSETCGGLSYKLADDLGIKRHTFLSNLLREVTTNCEFRGGGISGLEIYKTDERILVIAHQKNTWNHKEKINLSRLFLETRRACANLPNRISPSALEYDPVQKKLILKLNEDFNLPEEFSQLLEKLSPDFGVALDGLTIREGCACDYRLPERFGLAALGMGLEMLDQPKRKNEIASNWQVTYSDDTKQTAVMYERGKSLGEEDVQSS